MLDTQAPGHRGHSLGHGCRLSVPASCCINPLPNTKWSKTRNQGCWPHTRTCGNGSGTSAPWRSAPAARRVRLSGFWMRAVWSGGAAAATGHWKPRWPIQKWRVALDEGSTWNYGHRLMQGRAPWRPDADQFRPGIPGRFRSAFTLLPVSEIIPIRTEPGWRLPLNLLADYRWTKGSRGERLEP